MTLDKKILTLDGLRGYAALLVLWAHIPQVTNSYLGETVHLLSSKLHAAYVGVDIFFVLSGFLITRILLYEKRTGTFSFRKFYIKRALRLFPIYYLTIIVVGFFITWDGILPISLYVSNYYFSYNLTPHPMRHTWSLAVEEQFYLLWPLILYFFNTKTSRLIIGYLFPIISIVAAYYSFKILDIELFENVIYRGTHYRILSLAIGSYIAFYEKKTLDNVRKISYLFLGLILFSMTVFSFELMPDLILKMILSSLLSSYILILSLNVSKIKILFTGRFIRFIGTISYGLYLYHYPILYFFNIEPGEDVPVSFGFAILIILTCFIVPIISYYFIEKPILKIKNKLK
tara:strand:+ start:98 stop:1129 length:1032 start_codon:yes stop_codon:yes gene_type:complete